MSDETRDLSPEEMRAELAAFNAERRALLGGKPIDPEGEEALMPREDGQ